MIQVIFKYHFKYQSNGEEIIFSQRMTFEQFSLIKVNNTIRISNPLHARELGFKDMLVTKITLNMKTSYAFNYQPYGPAEIEEAIIEVIIDG